MRAFRVRVGVLISLVSVMLVVALPYACALLATRSEREVLHLLKSPNVEARKEGASLATHASAPNAWQYMADALSGHRSDISGADSSRGPELDLGVRESFVHALGRTGRARFFDTIAAVLQKDADPHVRIAAWGAAARLDAQRFRELVSRNPAPQDPWDRDALAAAWLELGDTRGVGNLLRAAEDGTDAQRRFASQSLFRGLAPLLEAVGRWPLDARVSEGDPWPPELVAEVRGRCIGLDLQALAGDACQHLAHAMPVRRDIGRLNSTRARLIHLLGIP